MGFIKKLAKPVGKATKKAVEKGASTAKKGAKTAAKSAKTYARGGKKIYRVAIKPAARTGAKAAGKATKRAVPYSIGRIVGKAARGKALSRNDILDILAASVGVELKKAPRKQSSNARKPKKQLGPPKVGMRTVRGRGGKPVTIKRPSPRHA